MKLKLIALSTMMAITMGLTACSSNEEQAVDDLADAQEEVQDAAQELNDADAVVAPGAEAAVADAAMAVDEAQATVEPMADDTAMVDDTTMVDPMAVDAADEVVVVEPAQ